MLKVIDNFLSEEICNKIIKDNLSNFKPIPELPHVRRCTSKFIEAPKIREELIFIVNEIRKDLTVDSTFEFIQYSKDDHFEWHNDVRLNNPKTETISAIILLNNNFKGGDLLYRENLKITKSNINVGSLIIFPSKLQHKVNKITEGFRYSLCCWFYKDNTKFKSII
jgi:predicted 2-oxoglutarate/Fe(II)-dependent dioxygenase YbiX